MHSWLEHKTKVCFRSLNKTDLQIEGGVTLNKSKKKVPSDDGDTRRCLHALLVGVALEKLTNKLLQGGKVALALPRVVVRALGEDGQAFRP